MSTGSGKYAGRYQKSAGSISNIVCGLLGQFRAQISTVETLLMPNPSRFYRRRRRRRNQRRSKHVQSGHDRKHRASTQKKPRREKQLTSTSSPSDYETSATGPRSQDSYSTENPTPFVQQASPIKAILDPRVENLFPMDISYDCFIQFIRGNHIPLRIMKDTNLAILPTQM